MGRWSWIALGAGAYLAFVLATFPAGAALRWLAPPGVTVGGVAGTVWDGNAVNCSIAGFAVEQVRWRMRPWGLVLGRIAASVEVRLTEGFVTADLTASAGSIALANLRGAAALPTLAAVLPVQGVRGQASISLDTLEIVDWWPVRAVGEIRLAGLETAPLVPMGAGRLVALGDYAITFAPAGERQLAANIVDTGGPLEVTGTVTLDASRAYALDALVRPRAGADEMLTQGLNVMTPEPDAEGRRRLSLTGTL